MELIENLVFMEKDYIIGCSKIALSLHLHRNSKSNYLPNIIFESLRNKGDSDGISKLDNSLGSSLRVSRTRLLRGVIYGIYSSSLSLRLPTSSE
jgi:hypothetical protein